MTVSLERPGDLVLFEAVVEKLRAGESYYSAVDTELKSRGYPTGSVFNWRQPLIFQVLAWLQPRGAQLLSIGLVVLLGIRAARLLRKELLGPLPVLHGSIAALALSGAYFTEVWAGTLLALSAIAYADRRYTSGAAWALLALFVRELAVPYCLVAVCLSLQGRRWREMKFWVIGGALYALYFGAHVSQVLPHIQPGAVVHSKSWLYWGGLPFLFRTWQHGGLLSLAPDPVFALFVVALVAAWWAPQMPVHVRFGVVAYSLCFLGIGLPINGYWGYVTAPLVGLWLAYAPQGVTALFGDQQLQGQRSTSEPPDRVTN